MDIVIIVFMALMFAGLPVGFAIGISGVFYFFQHPEFPITTIVQLPITLTQSVTLLAVPLFIFAGHLMNLSGITTRLIELSMLLVGHMRGALAQVSVALATLMGGVCGSSNADAAMEARILGPDMIKQGYSKGYTSALIGYSSLITSTIPPGVGMILYGTTGNVSIGRLFAAGLTMGLILAVIYMIVVRVTAGAKGYKPVRERMAPIREIIQNLKTSIWALIFPLFLLFCLRLGLFTPSEVGAMACVYVTLIGVFIYRKINRKELYKTLRLAILDIGGIMLMISMSGILGYGIPYDKIPQRVTGLIMGFTDNPYVVMSLVVLFLIVVGLFIEGSIVIIISTPILLPLITKYGFDPVVFGIIVSVVVTMGILTPPVGVAMFTICKILDCDLIDFLKESWPFILAVLVLTVIMVMFPGLVLFLPNLIFG